MYIELVGVHKLHYFTFLTIKFNNLSSNNVKPLLGT